MRAMGGSLVLESEGPGKGARAVISLPNAERASRDMHQEVLAA
jgi:hypothetical protein